jgi:hypothetical protein
VSSVETKEKAASSRRGVVGAVRGGVVPSVIFATSPAQAMMASENVFEDPKIKYPKPQYRKQFQTWPGVVGQMEVIEEMKCISKYRSQVIRCW